MFTLEDLFMRAVVSGRTVSMGPYPLLFIFSWFSRRLEAHKLRPLAPFSRVMT